MGPVSPLTLVLVWTELSFLGTRLWCCMQGLQEARCSCQAGELRETPEAPTPPPKAVLGQAADRTEAELRDRERGQHQTDRSSGGKLTQREGDSKKAPDTCWSFAGGTGLWEGFWGVGAAGYQGVTGCMGGWEQARGWGHVRRGT